MERDLEDITKQFQAQTKEMEKEKADRDFLEDKVEELEKEKKKLKRNIQSLETEVEESKKAVDENISPSNDEEVSNKMIMFCMEILRVYVIGN